MTQALIKLEKARQAIAEAKDVTELKGIRNQAEALRYAAKQAGIGMAGQNEWAEIRLRAERRAGELLADDAKNGKRQTKGRPRKMTHHASFSPTLKELGVTDDQSTRWQNVAKVPSELFERYLIEARTEAREITTADLFRLITTGSIIAHSTGDEWYTPAEYIESVWAVMGGVDLDPASCEQANETVKASTFYSKRDNGLDHDWPGRVFMNPPYSLSRPFADKLIEQFVTGITSEAVVLFPAHSIETKWFAAYWNYVFCFTGHRISFDTPIGKAQAGNISGSVFIYLGHQQRRFADEFSMHGYVVKRWP